MTSKVFPAAFALISLAYGLTSTKADRWIPPYKTKYCSQNKKYCLEVTPKQLESQLKYFEDKVNNKSDAGAVKGRENYAKGTFYVRGNDGGYASKSSFRLVNEVGPVCAVVSDNGDYVVTFDNWHRAGYGDDVVVIYRADGSLIKKFGLENLLTEGDIGVLVRTTSSIWWGGKHEIDEDAGLLVLKIVATRKSSGDEGSQIRELKIDLATGRPLEAKKDLFPNLQIVSTVTAEVPIGSQPTSPGEMKCSPPDEKPDFNQATKISAEVLQSKVRHRVMPPYPPIAKATRVDGIVEVEVLISKTGDVKCARPLSGHALLRGAAVAAAFNWKFEPFEVSSGQSNTVGTVAFSFKLSTKADTQRQDR